jgi:hypothetical protein
MNVSQRIKHLAMVAALAFSASSTISAPYETRGVIRDFPGSTRINTDTVIHTDIGRSWTAPVVNLPSSVIHDYSPPPIHSSSVTVNADFSIENNSDTTINRVYVRRKGVSSWGSDRLTGTLSTGESFLVTMPSYGPCWHDILIVFENNVRRMHRNRNLCSESVIPAYGS